MASSSSYSHSTPSSSSQPCNYDVFISFRGEDTRKTFVDHLYSSLKDRKISTYKDDETLPRGESIRPSLFNAIEGSRIVVIIFSKNYGDSSWCLEELAHIMKCKDERELSVMPIFYDVTPSEVRKQEGEFGKGFAKQEVGNINKVEFWKKALVGACEIAGWETKNIANGHESKAIKKIVDTISKKLFIATFGVDEDLVGMMTRVQELEAQLEIESHGVRMVGIWGVGGSGKTTLASSLCRKISSHFQDYCIVENIREESNQHGLKVLQQKIISRLLKTEMNLQDVEEGKHMIRRLSQSNVLIILDDVDNHKQLDALVGSHKWFGSGSRIIITTRNKHLLITHKVDVVYPIKLLSDEEAIQLFNKRAYNEKAPLKYYNSLSLHVVSYAARLPLALKVLGCFLYDKDEKEWRSTLDRLKDTPQTEILEQLKISYDGLDSHEQEIVLDIACFFRFKEKDEVMEILEACGYHPDIGVKVLTEKALVTIVDGSFDMHHLVQEMGQYIVRKEDPIDPRKRSRVWKHEEIKNLCLANVTMENYKIEAIECRALHRDHLSPFYKNVSSMNKLRYLSLALDNDVDKNAKGHNYPRTPLPYKHLPNLKVLTLHSMDNLLSLPNFEGLPSLKKLTLHRCASLEKIHPALGKHTSLEHVSVMNCRKLRTFPTLVDMRKLKTLKIRGCHESLKFPVIESNMESLVELYLQGILIDVLQLSSLGERCPNLISLCLSDCFYSVSTEVNFDGLRLLNEFKLHRLKYRKMPDHKYSWLIGKLVCGSTEVQACYTRLPFVLSQLPCHLQKLNLGFCRLKDGEIPCGIGEMFNLEDLNLSGNHFTRIDFTLSQLPRLKFLDISYTQLVELPKLPSSLIVLKADSCMSLTTIRDCYTNCKWLCDVSLKRGRNMNGGGKLLEFMLQGKAVENNHSILLELEGVNEIANGFFSPLLIRGSRCTLKLPENWHNEFSGFLMCAVIGRYSSLRFVSMKQVMSDMEYEDNVVREERESDGDKVTCFSYVSFASLRHTTWWKSIYKALSISFHHETPVDKISSGFGVRMVSRKSSDPTETSMTREKSKFSCYIPTIDILQDSQYALKFRYRELKELNKAN